MSSSRSHRCSSPIHIDIEISCVFGCVICVCFAAYYFYEMLISCVKLCGRLGEITNSEHLDSFSFALCDAIFYVGLCYILRLPISSFHAIGNRIFDLLTFLLSHFLSVFLHVLSLSNLSNSSSSSFLTFSVFACSVGDRVSFSGFHSYFRLNPIKYLHIDRNYSYLIHRKNSTAVCSVCAHQLRR